MLPKSPYASHAFYVNIHSIYALPCHAVARVNITGNPRAITTAVTNQFDSVADSPSSSETLYDDTLSNAAKFGVFI